MSILTLFLVMAICLFSGSLSILVLSKTAWLLGSQALGRDLVPWPHGP